MLVTLIATLHLHSLLAQILRRSLFSAFCQPSLQTPSNEVSQLDVISRRGDCASHSSFCSAEYQDVIIILLCNIKTQKLATIWRLEFWGHERCSLVQITRLFLVRHDKKFVSKPLCNLIVTTTWYQKWLRWCDLKQSQRWRNTSYSGFQRRSQEFDLKTLASLSKLFETLTCYEISVMGRGEVLICHPITSWCIPFEWTPFNRRNGMKARSEY